MSRLIDGDEMLEKVSTADLVKELIKREGVEVVDIKTYNVISAPTVEERKTGKWIENQNGTYKCDQCGCKHSKSNYCPNCGARMEVNE